MDRSVRDSCGLLYRSDLLDVQRKREREKERERERERERRREREIVTGGT